MNQNDWCTPIKLWTPPRHATIKQRSDSILSQVQCYPLAQKYYKRQQQTLHKQQTNKHTNVHGTFADNGKKSFSV